MFTIEMVYRNTTYISEQFTVILNSLYGISGKFCKKLLQNIVSITWNHIIVTIFASSRGFLSNKWLSYFDIL